MVDLINRGGGILQATLHGSQKGSEEMDRTVDVHGHCDGVEYTFKAGHVLHLKPGQSITMMPGRYHKLESKPGTGMVLIGEVSQCNDDNKDNRFADKAGRFAKSIEDEKPYRLFCNEYRPAAGGAKS